MDDFPSLGGAESLSAIGQEHPKKSLTLGDVLYAGARTILPEEEWVNLVRSIAAGDQVALHALYERSHRIVFTLIVRITANREAAEELTIDVFHDIWRRARDYDATNGTVLGWIMNQARARSINHLRSHVRKKRSPGGARRPQDGTAPDPRHLLEISEQRDALRAALGALTQDERLAIETTFFGGLTYGEAAARLNQPLGAVKTRIRSGLHKLRHALAAGAEKP